VHGSNDKITDMIKITSKQITLTALFIALGVIVPFVFHQVALAGRIFLPMHIPVLLAGIFVGPLSGLFVGLVCPVISFFLTGMPPPYAVPLMSLELAAYGISVGVLIKLVRSTILALLLSMIVGRLVFALGLTVFGMFLSLPYGPKEYIKVSVVTGLPGIVLQLILIPLLVKAFHRANGKLT
jgi:riboflavin transporter FmnP